MGHQSDGLILMTAADGLELLSGPPIELQPALAAGGLKGQAVLLLAAALAGLRPTLLDLGAGQPLPKTIMELAQFGAQNGFQVMGHGYRLRGLPRSGEVAAIDKVIGLGSQAPGGQLRLALTQGVEGDISLAHADFLPIPIGLAVADQIDTEPQKISPKGMLKPAKSGERSVWFFS